ncbi:MAG: non-canonical purine NTP pyrophosphatase [Crocinitomicaceae bacterium]|nr:non-canonical purine NTP pyrophosphatase [Crocinitomicaceae bacterium]|tara:strand:- start:25 stop:597 length:573 start_codon:yes stop_codon:yes gene_type:complete
MQELIFATNNTNKLREIQEILGASFSILSLKDAGIETEIPEDYETLEENALQKAQFIYERTGKNVFSDDTGLEVEALNGAPGVYSARYAGSKCDSEDNMKKLLVELEGKENRKAQFRTVVALIIDGKEYTFEGACKGQITLEKSGSKGFGYDPVFQPEGYGQTFAELSAEEKNRISHRGKAIQKLAAFLK